MPVKPIFENEYLTSLLKVYVKSQKSKDKHLAKTMPKVLERITNEVVGEDSDSDVLYSDSDIPAHLPNGEQIIEADIAKYTKKQYNTFGWARVNGIITPDENNQFRSEYADVIRGKYAPKTKNGEYMISVGEDGVQNVIVFASGSLADTKISKVIRISLDSNTDINDIAREIYEEYRFGYDESYTVGAYYEAELVISYTPQDCPTYQERKNRSKQRGIGLVSGEDHQDHQRKQDGRGNLAEGEQSVEDILYSEQDSDMLTNRVLLANALESVARGYRCLNPRYFTSF